MFLRNPHPLHRLHALPRLAPHDERGDTSSRAELFSARGFEWLLERERSLADRGGRTFGLLLVELSGPRRAGSQLCARLLGELRSTDVLGRFGRHRIGVLLPETDARGIRGVEARVGELAHAYGLELETRSVAYPGSSSVKRSMSRKASAPEGSTDENLWSFLAPPVPLWKRALDLSASALLLLALVPLFALVAVAIRIESPGPVFFRQKRVGRGGRVFDFYKFRSMRADAEARKSELADENEQRGPIFKMRRDPRITRVGRWIRRASIDELPQLWNVLRGDISLVGPRPPTPDEVCRYELWQRRRLSVPGGLTCLWQVSGRSEIGFEEWMRLDMRYVARRGLWEDLVLLARTLPAVLSGRGAY